jgi:hypothetical protein
VDASLEEIVRRLNGEPDREDSYEAQEELQQLGTVVLPTMARLLPTLTRFGQLSAIEVLQRLGDPTCGPALVGLLTNEDDTVRGWSAVALGELGVQDAVEPIRTAYWACLGRGDQPDWSEPHLMRWALTAVGGRTPVVPALTARLQCDGQIGREPTWPSTRLEDVVNDLSDHDQAVLFFQCWQKRAGTVYGVDSPSVERDVDFTASWPDLVSQSREWTLLEAAEAPNADDVFVTINWIGEDDLRPLPPQSP